MKKMSINLMFLNLVNSEAILLYPSFLILFSFSDWSRWVLKGHKGFVLTKDEVQDGFTADKYTDRLKRRPDGTWIWGGDDSGAKATSLDALTCLASRDAVEAITDATPSHDSDSIEVKRELLGLDSDDVVLNINGKRLRGDDGDSPQNSSTQQTERKKKVSVPIFLSSYI
jgi:hypothetical protein